MDQTEKQKMTEEEKDEIIMDWPEFQSVMPGPPQEYNRLVIGEMIRTRHPIQYGYMRLLSRGWTDGYWEKYKTEIVEHKKQILQYYNAKGDIKANHWSIWYEPEKKEKEDA